MRPALFKGEEGPIEAENWLLRIEKILEGMYCPKERKVSLETFALEERAERGWRGLYQDKFEGIPDMQIKWNDFTQVFRDWFVPPSTRSQMQDKFMRLVQGDRSVMLFEAEFTTLARYAPQLVHTMEDKFHRFFAGLKDAIRQPLVPLRIEDYTVLVERARMIEEDLQNTQRRRDFQKRKSCEVMGVPQDSYSKSFSQGGKFNWKKTV
ncbi:hypothetical protein MA16_Dca027688 [Dendrobium catenatum]|uniref:Retrotransposon gag domain-containing protein n=1 Tax=Dendrobium catenatum TaxID=906689 RepID=A0A2I0V987_9ASPA|nr:hypothetical protein MA16_Dca027688 [Dendrobium catenatum]